MTRSLAGGRCSFRNTNAPIQGHTTRQCACCVYLTPEDWRAAGRRGGCSLTALPPPSHLFCVCQSALGGNRSLRLRLCFSVKAKFGSSTFKRDRSGTFCLEGVLYPHSPSLGSVCKLRGPADPSGEADHLSMRVAWATGSSLLQWSQHQPGAVWMATAGC